MRTHAGRFAAASEYRRLTSKRLSIVDHILSGAPWPNDLVEAVNDRSDDQDRDIEF